MCGMCPFKVPCLASGRPLRARPAGPPQHPLCRGHLPAPASRPAERRVPPRGSTWMPPPPRVPCCRPPACGGSRGPQRSSWPCFQARGLLAVAGHCSERAPARRGVHGAHQKARRGRATVPRPLKFSSFSTLWTTPVERGQRCLDVGRALGSGERPLVCLPPPPPSRQRPFLRTDDLKLQLLAPSAVLRELLQGLALGHGGCRSPRWGGRQNLGGGEIAAAAGGHRRRLSMVCDRSHVIRTHRYLDEQRGRQAQVARLQERPRLAAHNLGGLGAASRWTQ